MGDNSLSLPSPRYAHSLCRIIAPSSCPPSTRPKPVVADSSGLGISSKLNLGTLPDSQSQRGACLALPWACGGGRPQCWVLSKLHRWHYILYVHSCGELHAMPALHHYSQRLRCRISPPLSGLSIVSTNEPSRPGHLEPNRLSVNTCPQAPNALLRSSRADLTCRDASFAADLLSPLPCSPQHAACNWGCLYPCSGWRWLVKPATHSI